MNSPLYLTEDGAKRNNHLLVVDMNNSLAKIDRKSHKVYPTVPTN